ncbi:MAG: hypothetical protein AABW79_01200 [Nanoarchaeota archaeon]
MKALIFDSGPLINFSINGLLDLLEKFHQNFDGKFIITSFIKSEVVNRPLKIRQFELGALRINQLIEKKILEFPSSIGLNDKDVEKETFNLTDRANHFLKSQNYWINLVSEAEMSCFAVANALKKKNIDSLIAMDERTARMLCEKPENLQRLMSQKLHKDIIQTNQNLQIQQCKIVRSTELAYIAFKKGLIKLNNPLALEALLYATKFNGSSISFNELEELKRL